MPLALVPGPIAPRRIPAAAVGRVLSEAFVAIRPVPAAPIATRDGWAAASAATAGAGPYAPSPPARAVRQGRDQRSLAGRCGRCSGAIRSGRSGTVRCRPSGRSAWPQSNGFFAVGALEQGAEAGSRHRVRLIGGVAARAPGLTVVGSRCTWLDAALDLLAAHGIRARALAVGSLGDLAPAPVLNPRRGAYNAPFLEPGLCLVPGRRRLQGVVFRPGDGRFEGLDGPEPVRRAAADPECLLVNRNAGLASRILLDGLLGSARRAGYANQPKSHNAVATAVAQGHADRGVAIEPVARACGLGFLPLADEQDELFLPGARIERVPVRTFFEVATGNEAQSRLAALGLSPASTR